MAKYISREAVFQVVQGIANGIADRDIEALKAKDMKGFYEANGAKEILDSVETALCYIPAADVQPVKHGRWLNHHAIWIDQPKIEGWFVQAKCSVCEKWAHVMNPYTKSVDYECCPHCGARMDGDTECHDTK